MNNKPLYVWLFALNVMCLPPWTFGPLTFSCLVLTIYTLYTSQASQRTESKLQLNAKWTFLAIIAISILISIIGFTFNPEWIIDIAANTYAATENFLQGNNPYTHRSQLWVETFPENTPNIETSDNGISMFGVPYFHGYPYFPVMMLSYVPAYWVFNDYLAIRVTHALLIIMNLGLMYSISQRIFHDKLIARNAFYLAGIAYLGIFRFTFEAVGLGVTDLLISSYLLFSLLFLARKQLLLCGLFLGLAQASKLLPAPLALLAISLFLYTDRKAVLKLWCGFMISCMVFILPFLLWHPEGFISATILYYLTHHHSGDQTSLWYFLPAFTQPVFLITGIILSLGSILFCYRKWPNHLLMPMHAIFISYAIFMAFSKMSHLNYLWAVLPVGSLALAFSMSMRASQQHVE